MDVSRLLPLGGAINVDSHQRAEQERHAIAAVALWASGCLGHTERETAAYRQKTLATFDGGVSADRIVGDVATQVEVAGKPSLASFASIVFTQAMDQSNTSHSPQTRGTMGSSISV